MHLKIATQPRFESSHRIEGGIGQVVGLISQFGQFLKRPPAKKWGGPEIHGFRVGAGTDSMRHRMLTQQGQLSSHTAAVWKPGMVQTSESR